MDDDPIWTYLVRLSSMDPSPLVIHPATAELRGIVDSFCTSVANLPTRRFAGICGFDGFIDTFIRIQEPGTMAEFGSRVVSAAGISASYGAEHLGDRFGGNGPLIASALHQLYDGKIDLTYIGALGRPEVRPIFRSALEPRMKALYSLAEPAHSDCLEFRDGKVMLSDLRSCAEIDWPRLLEIVGADTIDRLLAEADFVAAVNWGKLINVESIWLNLARRLKALGVEKKKTLVFMDLAEFEQRSQQERLGLVETVREITEQCRTLLSFNLKEAWQMADVFSGQFHGQKSPEQIAKLAAFLRHAIGVDQVIVHPNDGAASASAERAVYLPGPFCREPLISTGAGDNFGAGCIAAALNGLDDIGMLLSGACASGYFVRTGRSATWKQMGELALAWAEGRLGDRI